MSSGNVSLEQLNLNLMLALHWLLAEQSVTRAARRMGVTQSAMSRSLAQLRNVLGNRLFDVVGRRLQPTDRALALRGPLTSAVDTLRGILRDDTPFEPRSVVGPLRLAATEHAMSSIMQPFLRLLWRAAPQLGVRIEPANSDSYSQLVNGRLDMLIGPKAGVTPSGLFSAGLLEERFATVLRRGNPAARRKLTLRRFCALDHVVVAPVGGDRPGVVSSALVQRGLERRVVARVPYFCSAIDLVARSDLALTLPASLAPRRLAIRQPPLSLPGFVLEAVLPLRLRDSELHRWLLQQLRRAAAPSGDSSARAIAPAP